MGSPRKLILVGLGILLLAACAPTAGPISQAGGPQSWIDAPLSGDIFPIAPVEIVAHSADSDSIAQMTLSVDGNAIGTQARGELTSLALMKAQWQPPAPGQYMLSVRAQDTTGLWGSVAQAIVVIRGADQPRSATDLPTRVITPTATTVPRPGVPPPSPVPTASITFAADNLALVLGQCTTLRWRVTNASQVLLDNAGVSSSGSKQDCPRQTTTHVLRIVTLDGQSQQRSVTITVITPTSTFTPLPRIVPTSTRTATPPPPPPTGCSGAPVISSFAASSSTIMAGGSSTLRWGPITNADSVQIDNGIGGVPAPGSVTVWPRTTTVYVLTAYCKGVASMARTIVNVIQPPTPTFSFRLLPTFTPTRPLVR